MSVVKVKVSVAHTIQYVEDGIEKTANSGQVLSLTEATAAEFVAAGAAVLIETPAPEAPKKGR